MSPAAELLCTLRGAGVRLDLLDDDLSVEGPVEVLTAEVYQQIVFYKRELWEILWDEPAPRPWPVRLRSMNPPPPPPPAVPPIIEAVFRNGIRAQIRRQAAGRYCLWLWGSGRWNRRRDVASPSADHARRTVEGWFGQPIHGWNVPEDGL